ncbi:protein adenylyltransferase SelO [Donghicola mangrovi]|uniref:Protein nucleotidyltransferase YdiU n=1 Tax=Donghicola mangrovi TaxID=2729614 RepID=A0A850PZY4_9RHOB|nr:YdiU family protein [Donghicola mangrovi]NVO22847.1 YdiU family protein [Donghicola mangrovi]
MTLHIPFDNSYVRLPSRFYARQVAAVASAPELIAFNAGLARQLGISFDDDTDALAAALSGAVIPDGAEPLAQAYAGHQFGGFSPQLGDGRALLLGEVVAPNGKRYDIQLKGSGRTPFSRNGDGKAWLGPVLREYVVSEAMHALGVPTTRALAAVATGDSVMRHAMLPGAVLTRVASSHLRIGTFQYFAVRGDVEALRTLTDFALARHYPEADGPTGLLQAVIDAQVKLIPHWMSLGFIHGVMNTDNTAISGETIDYGPCAFMDDFHPHKVFSSIDQQGRYAYSNQMHIVIWNLAQLASALVPLNENEDAAVEDYTARIHAMPDLLDAEWLRVFGRKIGIAAATPEDKPMIEALLDLMTHDRADFTNTFRALAGGTARDQFVQRDKFDAWHETHQQRIAREQDPQALMRSVNPVYIPRNHRIEAMINAAVDGDLAPFKRLMRVLADPFTPQAGEEDLTHPPTADEVVHRTFCGT